MDNNTPRPMTDAEEAHLLAVVNNLERNIALTRSGPGGIAQLRRLFIDDLKTVQRELLYRPRVRDRKPTDNGASQ